MNMNMTKYYKYYKYHITQLLNMNMTKYHKYYTAYEYEYDKAHQHPVPVLK